MLRESKPKFTRGFSSLVWSGAISKLFFPLFFLYYRHGQPARESKGSTLDCTVQQVKPELV